MAVGTKMTATFCNAVTGENAELSIRGDMFGLGTTVTLNGNTPVAQISRKLLHLREWVADKQTVSLESARVRYREGASQCGRTATDG